MTDLAPTEARLVRLFDAPEALLVALLLALALGALHALGPGHGKSITAAFLVGGQARARDAILLGAVVAAMHTASVSVLAVSWSALSAAATLTTGTVTAWMQVLAAVAVIAVGGAMLSRRRGPGGEPHHHHHLPPGGARPQGDLAIHAPPAASALDRRLLLALGTAGGLLPSPSAFLVLVSGILTGRVVYAGALVGAFAVGMAATLTAVGVAALRGRALLAGRDAAGGVLAAAHRRLPVLGAGGVLLAGLAYLGAAISALLR